MASLSPNLRNPLVYPTPLVQIDDCGSVAIDDHDSDNVDESEEAADWGTFPAASASTKPAHLVGFGEGYSSHVEDDGGSASKRARTEALATPAIPIFIADTRARTAKLMRLIEQGERSKAAQDAGAFVIRVAPFAGMSDGAMQKIAVRRRIWTRQRFVPTNVEGAYRLKVTNLNNKSENGNHASRICKETYWDDIASSAALYSHDFPSALHSTFLPWDMNSMLDDENFLPKVMPESCPGINSTFGYLGQAASTFAWHVEDACLGSMNVSLGGAAKVWYTISPEHQNRFRSRVLREAFPADFRACAGHDQHKQCVVSPDCVEDLMGLPRAVHTHEQMPGDIVVTLPGAFHSGFSTGMNFGEAINWGTASWIRAFSAPPNSPCQCRANLAFDPSLWNRFRCQLMTT